MKTILSVLLTITLLKCAYSQSLKKIWASPSQLETPESVLYDPDIELAFVSNLGKVLDYKTGDGFISLISLSGEIENLKWFTGMNDPKGMAIFKNHLYVADIDEILIINIERASLLKKIKVPNAKFLNDITVSENGTVFVSDMRNHCIYSLINGEITMWLSDPCLENVNGLWAENNKLYAGNSSIWEIDISNKEIKELVSNTIAVDGLEKIEENTFVFSNWAGKILISMGKEIVELVNTETDKRNTADIDFLPDHRFVLVPTFGGNTVDCYLLE